MKTAVMFDLDGTLWDAGGEVAASWNRVIEAEGLPCAYPGDRALTAADVHALMGRTLPDIADVLFPALPEGARYAAMQRCCDDECVYLRETGGGQLYPGLAAALDGLRAAGHGTLIVSNCQSGYIETFLDVHGLWARFDGILCAGDTGRGKGENIGIIMERQGVARAVYVGDTQGDGDAAAMAATPFVWARYGFGSLRADTPRAGVADSLTDAAALAGALLC